MAAYQIDVTESARDDLFVYTTFERKTITSTIRVQLTYQPTVETRRRKKLRDNPVASWELRIGKYRVFYEVDDTTRKVTIIAVGHKDQNTLFIRGEEVNL
jgi:mRNA-degrading endonuclease RelE of RelBE toxin-antitoxin system